MKALTIWQPWASLIIAGAKPYEWRCWPAPRALVGQRIVIHAGARKMVPQEVQDILYGIAAGAHPDLVRDAARQILMSVTGPTSLPLGVGLGTALLGEPRRADTLFEDGDHDMWALPLSDIVPFDAPVPASGSRKFWEWVG
jgi:hypothetical protein